LVFYTLPVKKRRISVKAGSSSVATVLALFFWVRFKLVGQKDKQHRDQEEDYKSGGSRPADEFLLFALFTLAAELLPQSLHFSVVAGELSALSDQ